MKTLDQANITAGTKVLIRSDLDVPIKNNIITNEYRLIQSLGTIKYVLEKGGYPIICGHIGKPDGKVVPELSTTLLKLWYTSHLGSAKFELIENLRFDPREESNDDSFAKELASHADIYVNDSFATCHREHASIVSIPRLLPCFAGVRLELEINNLNKLLENPERPFVCVVGGIKLESKKPALLKMLSIADVVLVGGRLGLDWKEDIPSNLHLPSDYATTFADIGPNTINTFNDKISNAKTIVWTGPVGAYEKEEFSIGTKAIATKVVEATRNGAFTFIGGGNTIEALEKLGFLDEVSFVSTGGGAMLQYLVDGTLPGITALN